ncbi:MAG TPA: alkyl sulfatase C-terminal domain-containing protein [Mycobacteriales bacterium]|nr:alkyl sulfatase C-terminal domain-containing protein [Mycobacteriales bacterium]
MATAQECRAALDALAARLSGAHTSVRSKVDERRVACRITDLDLTYVGQLRDGGLHDITERTEQSRPAQITLTLSSDDLLALTDGTLGAGSAWATGRLRIDAGLRDLLTLRTMLS